MTRIRLVPVLVVALGLGSIAAISLLQQRSIESRDAQLKLAQVDTDLNQLQNAPFKASPTTGGGDSSSPGTDRPDAG